MLWALLNAVVIWWNLSVPSDDNVLPFGVFVVVILFDMPLVVSLLAVTLYRAFFTGKRRKR